ncbi:PE domain-containing protein [Actinophytocola sp. NPDC049390]|uniref:PE domain-containing protein n=1 Tax=Actinophytocola sp. NPDC049390 TaxID=3363894 RepID=UPI00379490DC
MPFWEEGAEAAPPPPAARMVVDPDNIVRLKQRLEGRLDILRSYHRGKGNALFTGRAPGTDPCSERNAEVFTANGEAAAEALAGFIVALNETIDRLNASALAYGLVERDNTDRFGQGFPK